MNFLKKAFLKQDGGKKVLKMNGLLFFFVLLGLFGLIGVLFLQGQETGRENDTSYREVTTGTSEEEPQASQETPPTSNGLGGVSEKKAQRVARKRTRKRAVKIRYRANQVILREDFEKKSGLFLGGNVLGRLMAPIDSRYLGPKKVILPKGVRDKSGREVLPPETVLVGTPHYLGRGERIFIRFNKGVLPSGREVALQAQALDFQDQGEGVRGQFYSNTKGRMASVVGLGMVGSVAEVLVKKESLSVGAMPTPKATLKNGLLHGLSKAAQGEAGRKAQEMAGRPEYVRIEAHTEILVNFWSIAKGGMN